MATNDKPAPTGSSQASTSKPTTTHGSAGSEALRRAYAKYNVHPTISNPAAVRHKVSSGDHATEDPAKESDSKNAKEGGSESK
ncbi:hypothetical protein SEUCBS139899_006047 [Sporothrix eucalyptigena]|uniref:Uncharacterized protein n=1 Tax=Sporothrix eucalyptigena TaxID=1812306 RepID=A0ABP0D0U2_9PEZI